MSMSPSRRFPATVTQLPVTCCQICHRTVPYRPGNLTEVLTGHCRRIHPQALRLTPRQPAAGTPNSAVTGADAGPPRRLTSGVSPETGNRRHNAASA